MSRKFHHHRHHHIIVGLNILLDTLSHFSDNNHFHMIIITSSIPMTIAYRMWLTQLGPI